MARKVVLAGACRTAIGTMGGTLSNTPAPDLGTVVIKEALKRARDLSRTCFNGFYFSFAIYSDDFFI